jgi:hypothetical protein
MDTVTLPASFRNRMIDAVREITGTRAAIEGTGGGCEALIVQPLEGGRCLWITDGDLGVPDVENEPAPCAWCRDDVDAIRCRCTGGQWLVSLAPHGSDDECSECGDCLNDAPYTEGPEGDLSIDALRTAVIRVLSGENDNTPIRTE